MGQVLPHGGFRPKIFQNAALEWREMMSRVGTGVEVLEASFAQPSSVLGFFHQNSDMRVLLLQNYEDYPGRNEWVLGGQWSPVGMAQYFVTKETADALRRVTPAVGFSLFGPDEWVDAFAIDGRNYRLHAACFGGTHVAILLRVET